MKQRSVCETDSQCACVLGAERRGLAKNTGFLYVLSLSSQVVNVALIPFETRVLGSEAYGVIAFAVAMSVTLSIFFDFGFILSATEKTVRFKGEGDQLSTLLANVALAKLLLALTAGVVTTALVIFVSPFKEHKAVFLLYYLAYAVNALLPDFFYRGYEDMKTITIRSVIVKVLFALPVFMLVSSPADMWIIPILLLGGNTAAVMFSYIDVKRRYGVTVRQPSLRKVSLLLKESFGFFASRFATTFFQSMNSVVLGFLYPGQAVVGWYGASEKFLSYAKVVSSPVADSLYPYMVRKRDFRLIGRMVLLAVPMILVSCGVVWHYATPLCLFVFGAGYEASADLLRCLLPAVAVIFPSYIIGFPVLVPMGLARYANRSTFVGASVQVMLLCALLAADALNAMSLCISSSVVEVSVFVYRLWAIWAHREYFRRPERDANQS